MTAAYNPVVHGARCDLCPLARKGTVVAPEPAAAELKLIVAGEAPGHVEEREGQPFLGASGQYLRDTLRKLKGAARRQLHLTNAALCRGSDDGENKRAAECCAPRLLTELAQLPADVPILTLGALAAKSVLGVSGILKTRGFVWRAPAIEEGRAAAAARAAGRLETGSAARHEGELKAATLAGRAAIAGRRVHPTLHPAFVLRAELWADVFETDVRRALEPLPSPLDSFVPGFLRGGPEQLAGIDTDGAVTLDIETDSLDPLTARITCVGLSDGARTTVLYPWDDAYAPALAEFLRECESVVCHNGYNYDQICLSAHGVGLGGINWHDTLIAHHAYASHLPQSLAHVVTETCTSEPWKILAKGAQDEKGGPVQFAKLSAETLTYYNAQDALLTARAWARRPRNEADEKVYEHDRRLAAVSRNMIQRGVPVDYARIDELKLELEDTAGGLKLEMRRLTGRPEFIPERLADVRGALYETFQLPVTRTTLKGKAATDKAVIESLRGQEGAIGAFARALSRYRLVTKIKATYLDALPLNAATGRAHFNWKSFGSATGRFSCRMQSTPRYAPRNRKTGEPTPEGRVREVVRASLGKQLIYFDVSQAEMRIAAHLSGDEAFMRACEGDVHANNAKVLFPEIAARGWFADGDAKKDVQRGKPYRDIAKNIGFAIIYEASDETAYLYLRAQGFPVEFGAVVRMMSNVRSAYRQHFRWITASHATVTRLGWMRTPVLGRIRHFGHCPIKTEVANYPVQGGLADVMNARMIEIESLYGEAMPVVAQIHDACIYEVAAGAVPWARERIIETWARPIPEMRNLVLPLDLKVGDRWSDFG